MVRRVVVALFVVVAASLVADVADAAPVSRNNPYASFNISGVNYGSMLWEQQHRGSSSNSRSYSGGGARVFRRR
jgi:hypothetical protein